MPTSTISFMNSNRRVNDGLSAAVSGSRFRTAIVLGATACALAGGTREPREAELLLAYVDPGSAGFVIVSVLGFLSAVGYTLRNAFGRLLTRLRSPGGRRRGAAGDRPAAPDDDVPPPF